MKLCLHALLIAIAASCGSRVFAQDGMLDPTFRPRFNDEVGPILVQFDGKILVGGYFTEVNGKSAERLVRLNRDGSIDETFTASADHAVNSIVQWTNGQITVRGYFKHINGVPRNGIARLNEDGALDVTFVPATYNGFANLALQSDGRVIFGADTQLIRLNADGSRDDTFQVNAGRFDTIEYVTAHSNVIVIGGTFREINGGTEYRKVAKLNDGGYVLNQFRTYQENLGLGIEVALLMPNGSVIVGGTAFTRLSSHGRIDPAFLYWASNLPIVFALHHRSDRIVAGGRFDTSVGFPASYLVSVNLDGSMESSFAHSGPDAGVWTIAGLADGRLLIGGAFRKYFAVDQPFIARLLSDQPVLDQRRIAPDQVELSWPAAYTNFVLQSASGVPSTNWGNVPGTPLVVSNICYVTNTAAPGNQFFRLVKQEP